MRTIQFINILFLFLLIETTYSQNYTLNHIESTISWTGKAAFSSYSLTGDITSMKGNISINNDTITKLDIIIAMKSLKHSNKKLENHLKNEDFFEVKTYPIATFTTDNTVIVINNKKSIIKGKLTIKDKTNSENIQVSVEKNESRILITFSHKIDRTTYGINHNSPSIFKRMKENAIADTFLLEGKIAFYLSI